MESFNSEIKLNVNVLEIEDDNELKFLVYVDYSVKDEFKKCLIFEN